MFRFANPICLYLLLLIPIFVIVYFFFVQKRKKNLLKFGDPELLAQLMPELSSVRKHVKFGLLMIVLALLVFILARPQFGIRNEEQKRKGIEAIIAVDVSNSMLCEDIAPSRLQKAKMLLSKIIEQLDEDKVGLIAFAGNAVTLLPITQDGVTAKMFLEQLTPQSVSVQGTNMSEAIERALAGFSASKSKKVGRALIFITDAEENEKADEVAELANKAREMGVRIFVLSIGTEAGGPIPIGDGKHKTDKDGNVVITHLNEQVGKAIAQAGNGVYMHVDKTDNAQSMLQTEIGKMQKEDFVSSYYSEYDEQFIAVAIILIIVLLIEMCIMEKKNPFFKRFQLFKKAAVILLLIGSFPQFISAQNAKELIMMGNKCYREGAFDKAETYYAKSLDKEKSIEGYYNLALSQFKQMRDSDVVKTLQTAIKIQYPNKVKRSLLYHMVGWHDYLVGLNHLKMQDGQEAQLFQSAIQSYESALILDPKNDETKYNLAMAQYMLKKSQQNQKNDKDKDKQDKDKQDKDKQNQDKDKDKDKDKDQNKDKQDKDKQDENKDKEDKKEDDKKQNAEPKKDEVDEKTIDQLLNSAQQDDNAVQKKVKMQQYQRRSLEKDW